MSGRLASTILALGIIAMFAVFLYGDSAPALPTLGNAPTFDNPFSGEARVYTLDPDADEEADVPATGTDEFETEGIGADDPNCDTNNAAGYTATPTDSWWGCLVDTFNDDPNFPEPDGIHTRVSVSPGQPTFGLDFEANNPTGRQNLVRTITINFNCRALSSPYVFTNFQIRTNGGAAISHGDFFDEDVFCDFGTFANHTITNDVSLSGITVEDLSDGILTVETGGTPSGAVGSIDFTWIEVVVAYSPTVECTGSFQDQADCYISQFVQFFIDLGALIIETFVFVSEWLFLIGTFIAAVFLIIAWLYAIPGMPPPLQAFVSIFVTAMGIVIVAEIVRMVRG